MHGLEAQDQGRKAFAGFLRDDRHRDHLGYRRAPTRLGHGQVADLRLDRQSSQREPAFIRRSQHPGFGRVLRCDQFPVGIKKPVKPGDQLRTQPHFGQGGIGEQIAQFVIGTQVEQIHRTILQGRMNPRLAREGPAPLHQRGMADLLDAVQQRQTGLKLALQLPFLIRGDVAPTHPDHRQGGDRYHQNQGDQQSAAKTCRLRRQFHWSRKSHGRSMRKLAPSCKTTVRSRVVLLSSQTRSLNVPAGKPSRRKLPSVSVMTKCGVASTRMAPRICS